MTDDAQQAAEIKAAKTIRAQLCIDRGCIINTGCGCLEAIATALRDAARREREACAKVAEEYRRPTQPKPSIAELEAILAQDTDAGIEIAPDGEVRTVGTHIGHEIATAIRSRGEH